MTLNRSNKLIPQAYPRRLGPKLSFEVVTEVTDDPVTAGIETKLPWLNTMKTEPHGDQYHPRNTLAKELNGRDFYRLNE
jgi:hypothetical protein